MVLEWYPHGSSGLFMGRQGCALLGVTLKPFSHLLGGVRVVYSRDVRIIYGLSGLCFVGGDFKAFFMPVRWC